MNPLWAGMHLYRRGDIVRSASWLLGAASPIFHLGIRALARAAMRDKQACVLPSTICVGIFEYALLRLLGLLSFALVTVRRLLGAVGLQLSGGAEWLRCGSGCHLQSAGDWVWINDQMCCKIVTETGTAFKPGSD